MERKREVAMGAKTAVVIAATKADTTVGETRVLVSDNA